MWHVLDAIDLNLPTAGARTRGQPIAWLLLEGSGAQGFGALRGYLDVPLPLALGVRGEGRAGPGNDVLVESERRSRSVAAGANAARGNVGPFHGPRVGTGRRNVSAETLCVWVPLHDRRGCAEVGPIVRGGAMAAGHWRQPIVTMEAHERAGALLVAIAVALAQAQTTHQPDPVVCSPITVGEPALASAVRISIERSVAVVGPHAGRRDRRRHADLVA